MRIGWPKSSLITPSQGPKSTEPTPINVVPHPPLVHLWPKWARTLGAAFAGACFGVTTPAVAAVVQGSAPRATTACPPPTEVKSPDGWRIQGALLRGDATLYLRLGFAERAAFLEAMPGSYALIPEADRADRCLAQRVLQLSPHAFAHLPAAWRHDRALAEQVVRREPELFNALPPALMADPRLLELHHRGLAARAVDDHRVQALREVIRAAPWLAADPMLLGRAAVHAPQLLLEFDETAIRRHPVAQLAHRKHVQRFRELGILNPHRIKDEKLWIELLANRHDPENRRRDPRPVAIVVGPRDDWNQAFLNFEDDLQRLVRRHRVMYFEIGKDHEFAPALLTATAKGRSPAALLLAFGHGEAHRVMLGPTPDSSDWLEIKDVADVVRSLNVQVLRPGAPIILWSCGVGAGGRGANNLVNDFYRPLFPRSPIWAYQGIGSAGFGFDLHFDSADRVVGARIGGDPAAHYVSSPAP